MSLCIHALCTYHGNDAPNSLCTISPDLNHGPSAVFKHMEAMLEGDQRSKIENFHGLSDSPSTQYRNKTMFAIMLKKMIPTFPNLKSFSWTYSEPGHGKGPVDGVGASLKRKCDSHVAYGHDVANFEQFEKCVQEIEGIKIISVHSITDQQLIDEMRKIEVQVKGELKLLAFYQQIIDKKNY